MYDECIIRYKIHFCQREQASSVTLVNSFCENMLTDTVVQAVVKGVYDQG